MRLTTTVPSGAVQKAAREMKASGLPLTGSYLLRFAIARLIGIPDEKMSDFVVARPGRKPANNFDDFLTELDQETS